MFAIVRAPIDPARLDAAVRDDVFGAVVSFLGIVRERADDGRPVHGLEYEAYDAMALAEFEKIAGEAYQRFGDVRLAIVHRAGRLKVGEIAVAVVVGSPHRGAAFDACEYAIDEVKSRVPIWKKELYADGEARWKANACGTHEPAV
jgi:molybdopterin synthase catalytic subunit